jgi:Rps23 Pro-64 3,4-dihydroxylase Tpa1-like proline 4-hydroxylase
LTQEDVKARFREGLFDEEQSKRLTTDYRTSSPYQHGVISGLVEDGLLRAVRDEIRENVSFTPKETDIYKIEQSGDLANLDGLDDEALAKLPSLLKLRDAMYSETFRDYISNVTDCGPLSGRKTDMAINVYTPGCYLLCHDDVIGSRRVSYILYLTDPDTPWKPEWGGALRLYPVVSREGKDGEQAKTPLPDAVKSIPPAWNQLAFFTVKPGESFHDVEEVYHAESAAQLAKDGRRIRMAISGWFHIPQIGEQGYVPGEEEAAAQNSGLMQLQGNPDQYDLPAPQVVAVDKTSSQSSEESGSTADFDFSETDLEFLLKYISPTYLTPDTLDRISDHFAETSSITLPDVFTPKFAATLRSYVEAEDRAQVPEESKTAEAQGGWKVARPPHKHRFLYLQPRESEPNGSPIQEVLGTLLPSRQFRVWLQKATSSVIESYDVVARRFRHGKDYTLATGHEGKPRLEVNLGLTPTDGWGDEVDQDPDAEEAEAAHGHDARDVDGKHGADGKLNGKGKGKAAPEEPAASELSEDATAEVGGHEVYMAGDDEANEDAAVYRSSGDDDNVLFFQAAAWNKMTIVVRDSGTLRFVKYVSRKAKGDRWDISGTFEIEEDEDGQLAGQGADQAFSESEEDVFKGFSDDDDSDSD